MKQCKRCSVWKRDNRKFHQHVKDYLSLKIPIAISDKQRLTSTKNRHHTSSKQSFKTKVRRQLNKEERNKRIGVSDEKIKELDASYKAFLLKMLKTHGETFKFYWPEDETNKTKQEESTTGFRFFPYNVNKSMVFLYLNKLEESLQNVTDQDLNDKTLCRFLNSIWVLGNNIVRRRISYNRSQKYVTN